ncbi:MAG: cytidine deaminase [Elusimicrobia bacterium]|nr:cytidine deaminase [Elusimicrobiota bacterium]
MKQGPKKVSREDIRELLALARRAVFSAYAPYSKFRVGAAVLTADGRIYTGSNIENASYGLTVCAERVGIFKAVYEGEKKLKAVAIVTEDPVEKSPCGACLQVMAEFASPETLICLDQGSRPPVVRPLKDFLPLPFRFPRKT